MEIHANVNKHVPEIENVQCTFAEVAFEAEKESYFSPNKTKYSQEMIKFKQFTDSKGRQNKTRQEKIEKRKKRKYS